MYVYMKHLFFFSCLLLCQDLLLNYECKFPILGKCIAIIFSNSDSCFSLTTVPFDKPVLSVSFKEIFYYQTHSSGSFIVPCFTFWCEIHMQFFHSFKFLHGYPMNSCLTGGFFSQLHHGDTFVTDQGTLCTGSLHS